MAHTTHLTDPFFPFHRLGLRRNPFGVLSEDDWFAITVLAEPIANALQTGFDHLLVLGEKGRGKSTTLNYLTRYFQIQGEYVAYERLPRWQWQYRTDITPLTVFALDETQRLAPWEEVRLFREAHGKRLIMGSHRNQTYAFQLRGWNVLTVHLEKTASRERLSRILHRRLDYFSLSANQTLPYFTDSAVDFLWEHYGDDLRSMNSFLYDFFCQLDEPAAITYESFV